MYFTQLVILCLGLLIFWKWRKQNHNDRMQQFEEYYGNLFGESVYPLLEKHYTFQEVCQAYKNMCAAHRRQIKFDTFLKALENELRHNDYTPTE